MTNAADTRTAVCACGQLQVACEGAPLKVSLCHCRDCQRRTGSAFGVAVFFDRESVSVEGRYQTFTRPSDSGFPVAFHFCPDCGGTVWWEPSRLAGRVAVAYGAFADGDMPAPEQQVYAHHSHGWVKLDIPEK